MPSYIIHVGPHKTGSTYIQRGLLNNSDALKNKGVLFPTHWQHSPLNPNHARLLSAIEHEDSILTDDFDSFEKSGFRTVVLSHEGLSSLNLQALQRLRRMLGANDIKVVYYVRRWTDRLYSIWNEFVVHGSSDTFLEFAIPHLADPRGSPFLNIGRSLRDLMTAFGRNSIRIVSFSSIVENDIDLFKHFCSTFLTDDVSAECDGAKANVSYSPGELELLRAMQAIDRRAGLQSSAKVVQRFRSMRDQLDISQLLAILDRYQRPIDLETTYAHLRPILLEQRRDLSDLVVGPIPGDFWYAEHKPIVTYTSLDYMLLPGMAETLLRLRAVLR